MGKYDPLRDYLAARSEGARELTMHFDQIEQLVGQLPQSARTRRAWWGNTVDARVEAQSWRAAGWHVRSVDLSNETVVFARGVIGAAPSANRAAPSEHIEAVGDGHSPEGYGAAIGRAGTSSSTSGEEGATSRRPISRQDIAIDLAAGLVAAALAGVTAVVGLTDLPWLALVLLGIAVGAIAFTMTQAIVSWNRAGIARRWWSFSTVLALLAAAGAFTYHELLDPATRPPAVPFSAVVLTDSSSIVSQGCRTIVLPGQWHNYPTPSVPLTGTNVNEWEASQRGVDGGETIAVVELQGLSGQVVVIGQPQVVVSSRDASIQGSTVQLSGGCGGVQQNRVFAVNLDQPNPTATLVAGVPYPLLQSGSKHWAQASSPSFTISASDPEYFVLIATTKKAFYRWFLELSWASLGKSGTILIKNGGAPFETTAAGPVKHYLAFGAWQG